MTVFAPARVDQSNICGSENPFEVSAVPFVGLLSCTPPILRTRGCSFARIPGRVRVRSDHIRPPLHHVAADKETETVLLGLVHQLCELFFQPHHLLRTFTRFTSFGGPK